MKSVIIVSVLSVLTILSFRYSVVLGTPDKVIDHMIEQKTDGDETEGMYLMISVN